MALGLVWQISWAMMPKRRYAAHKGLLVERTLIRQLGNVAKSAVTALRGFRSG
jgi:hypothetical protein